MSKINAWAVMEHGKPLEKISFDASTLKPNDVEIEVMNCGICHSDLSMIGNEWNFTSYPFVGGHEVVGRISRVGDQVKKLKPGQLVGAGWLAGSCNTCDQCVGGHQHHCSSARPTIVGRTGGFADKVQVQDVWAIPLPEDLDPESAGPLLCGGITVFTPLLDNHVLPTHKVGVIGIGGLGHMAIKFLNAWGCEVTAFTTSPDKETELKEMGAHHVVNSKDRDALKKLYGKFDFVLSTVNVTLNWKAYLQTLAPEGRLISVGMVGEPMQIPAASMIQGAKAVGGSDTGSPAMMRKMLEFAARHNIAPTIEVFPMSNINEALDHVKQGKARYRVVLTQNT